jgi:hypothetical protein
MTLDLVNRNLLIFLPVFANELIILFTFFNNLCQVRMTKGGDAQNYSLPWRDEGLVEDAKVSTAANWNPGVGSTSTQSAPDKSQMLGQHSSL